MRETHTAQTSLFDFYSQHEFSDFLRSLSDVLDGHPELLKLMERDLLTDGDRKKRIIRWKYFSMHAAKTDS